MESQSNMPSTDQSPHLWKEQEDLCDSERKNCEDIQQSSREVCQNLDKERIHEGLENMGPPFSVLNGSSPSYSASHPPPVALEDEHQIESEIENVSSSTVDVSYQKKIPGPVILTEDKSYFYTGNPGYIIFVGREYQFVWCKQTLKTYFFQKNGDRALCMRFGKSCRLEFVLKELELRWKTTEKSVLTYKGEEVDLERNVTDFPQNATFVLLEGKDRETSFTHSGLLWTCINCKEGFKTQEGFKAHSKSHKPMFGKSMNSTFGRIYDRRKVPWGTPKGHSGCPVRCSCSDRNGIENEPSVETVGQKTSMMKKTIVPFVAPRVPRSIVEGFKKSNTESSGKYCFLL